MKSFFKKSIFVVGLGIISLSVAPVMATDSVDEERTEEALTAEEREQLEKVVSKVVTAVEEAVEEIAREEEAKTEVAEEQE